MEKISLTKSNKKKVIKRTAEVLKSGGLVIFPSDTVYGVLVDATNEKAVEKLIAFKNRPVGKAISVFVANMKMAEGVVEIEKSKALLSQFLPGPFTVVLPSKQTTSKLLESEKETLGVRIPAFEPVLELVKEFGKPVTATSANMAGRSPHYSIQSLLNDVAESKQQLIDLIVDAGQLPRNKPSTVIDLTGSSIKTLRKGDVSFNNTYIYESKSENETKEIGIKLIKDLETSQKPVVLIIQGELGAGKTMFVKGIAESLGVDDIISPTYVIYYEYPLENKSFKNLYHFDLYQLEEPEEFAHLGIDKMLETKNIICFEWGERSAAILPQLQKAHIVFVTISYKSETERVIQISM